MNFQSYNNITSISNAQKRTTIINGVEYPWVKRMTGRSTTQINGKVYIDGYELKNGEWQRTLKGLFYLLF